MLASSHTSLFPVCVEHFWLWWLVVVSLHLTNTKSIPPSIIGYKLYTNVILCPLHGLLALRLRSELDFWTPWGEFKRFYLWKCLILLAIIILWNLDSSTKTQITQVQGLRWCKSKIASGSLFTYWSTTAARNVSCLVAESHITAIVLTNMVASYNSVYLLATFCKCVRVLG